MRKLTLALAALASLFVFGCASSQETPDAAATAEMNAESAPAAEMPAEAPAAEEAPAADATP